MENRYGRRTVRTVWRASVIARKKRSNMENIVVDYHVILAKKKSDFIQEHISSAGKFCNRFSIFSQQLQNPMGLNVMRGIQYV